MPLEQEEEQEQEEQHQWNIRAIIGVLLTGRGQITRCGRGARGRGGGWRARARARSAAAQEFRGPSHDLRQRWIVIISNRENSPSAIWFIKALRCGDTSAGAITITIIIYSYKAHNRPMESTEMVGKGRGNRHWNAQLFSYKCCFDGSLQVVTMIKLVCIFPFPLKRWT